MCKLSVDTMKETFGQKMQKWREAANVSQADLARRMGVSRNYISNLERDFSPTAKGGKPQPSVETCDKIAHALGVKVAEVRLAAGYAAPSEPEPTKDDVDRATEAARAAELIENFLHLPEEKQAQLLGIMRVMQGDPELMGLLKAPIEIVKLEDITESDVEEDEE